MSNILVTGISGFVGGTLVRTHKSLKVVVRENYPESFPNEFRIQKLNSTTNWEGAFDGIKSIIHLAGLAHSKSYTESDYRSVNTEGTLRLALKAAEAGVRRFVFVSSIGVNGTVTHSRPFLPSDTANPHNLYAQSKYEAELGLWDIAKKTGLEVVIVRPTLVYGANAPGNFGLLTKLIKKVPFLPFGFAKNQRDFICVQNLAHLLVVCANHERAVGNVFLASDNETVSTKGFTSAIAEGIGKEVFQIPVPVGLMRFIGKASGKSAMVEQLFGNLQVDSSSLKEVLDWTPPFTMKQAMSSLRNESK
ncbi:NAD-dependent epimerase/dehydratase family protein [Vibrio coralliirubri]|nr:NAD-dependent epimerase/dehydratase family protein [Vibrio coralliirubri]CDS95251.1 Putative UDP-glucose 4-epimerase [Vibrio coralliirubri]